VRRNILWPSKDIYHVDFSRHIDQLPIDFFAENFGDVGIIDRHGNDLESSAVHVPGNIECRLISLRFSLDAEHRDRFRLRKEVAKLVSVRENVVTPVGIHQPQINADGCRRPNWPRIYADTRGFKNNKTKSSTALFSLCSDPRLSALIRGQLFFQKFTPNAAITANTTAMIASPQINPDASGIR